MYKSRVVLLGCFLLVLFPLLMLIISVGKYAPSALHNVTIVTGHLIVVVHLAYEVRREKRRRTNGTILP